MISVVIAYATPEKQIEMALMAEDGCTILEAITQSKINESFPEIDLSKNAVGIFGKLATLSTVLRAGDRVEIYRSLVVDPKIARRLKAAKIKNAF